MKLRRIAVHAVVVVGYVAWSPCIALADDEPAKSEAPPAPPESSPPTPLAWDRAKDDLSIGMSVHRLQDDFGLGASISSPELAHLFRFTFAGGVAWYPYAQSAGGSQTWDVFEHARVVLEIGPGYLKGVPIRPYGFSGVTALFLPTTLSSQTVAFGAVGGFGFEVAFAKPNGTSGPITYYAQLGGIGTGAHASKLAGDPGIANGFLIDTGFRAYL